jgi:integrase
LIVEGMRAPFALPYTDPVTLPVIQRQLGHANLAITSVYLRGIDNTEIIHTIHERRPPMISASAGLRPGQ